ncbi:universal stress protein [Peptococcus simiae]|uniref:Universal stress protein n=1 Tax=Peptococcus simiae TaxID=1643805 RepID=A0ABW9GXC6_9FIRM
MAGGYEKILVPYDGSEASVKALAQAKILQDMCGARITLLEVLSNGLSGRDQVNYHMLDQVQPPDPASYRAAEADLNRLKADFPLPDRVQVLLAEGPVASTIIETIDREGYDLVVMGSEGLGHALKRFLLGSVTKYVLEHVDIPVMVLS